MLYEGSDFAEREAKMDVILRAKRLHVGHVANHENRIIPGTDRKAKERTELVLIRGMISNVLLDRMSAAQYNCRPLLWKALPGLATPFRLMNLPDQVRQRIYKLALPRRFSLGEAANGDAFPALVHVSSEVRKETLPLFYSHTTFDIACKLLITRPKYLKAWVEHIAGDNVQHVRAVNISSDNSIKLTYSDTKGLKVDVEADNSQQAVKKDIEARIELMEQCRGPLKLKGGFLFMALWGNVDIWEE